MSDDLTAPAPVPEGGDELRKLLKPCPCGAPAKDLSGMGSAYATCSDPGCFIHGELIPIERWNNYRNRQTVRLNLMAEATAALRESLVHNERHCPDGEMCALVLRGERLIARLRAAADTVAPDGEKP